MAGLESLSPQDRTRVIYAQARSEVSDRLWQAAIGVAQDDSPGWQAPCQHGAAIIPSEVMTLLGTGQRADTLARAFSAIPAAAANFGPGIDVARPAVAEPRLGLDALFTARPAPKDLSTTSPQASLGANAGFVKTLKAAAERSGLPASTLAAIVDAEAAKRPDGSWNLLSRNPRSSAAGLGQFLSGTWIGMAQTPGNWLYDVARQKGWLNGNDRVDPAARGSLLALRYDAEASINTIADYATSNIATIRRAGVRTGDDPQALASLAYLGHHLGPGDAIRYLKGGLNESRAAHLLKAQIGSGRAVESINRTGDAAVAHRDWLNSYIARKIRPDRFTDLLEASST